MNAFAVPVRTRAGLVAALVVSLIALAPARPARAATIAVTTTADEFGGGSGCGLREAIRAANEDAAFGGCAAGSGADTISLGTGTYTLSIPGTAENQTADGDLDVLTDITFLGQGSSVTVIDGNGQVTGERVFDIDPGAGGTGQVVALIDLTVRGGVNPGDGGGIWNRNEATLTLERVLVTGNEATNDGDGGGVFNDDATLSVIDSVVSGNEAGDGGGIANWYEASFSMVRSSVSENTLTTPGDGGGIQVWNDTTATITDSIIQNNTGADAAGGIEIWNNSTATITGTTISGNTAVSRGGGLEIANTVQVSITNTTISGNRSNGEGGGVEIYGQPSLTMNNVTINGNTAEADGDGSGDGGGIFADPATTGSIAARNSILAGNADSGGQAPDCSGEVPSQGHNLVGSTTGCTFTPGPGDIVGQDPLLGPLGDNGGPTPTQALLTGSPAIDAGDPAAPGSDGTSCAATDQRGVDRGCDIGAYELVLCARVPVNRVGAGGNDVLLGTEGPDGFLTGSGNDRVKGLGGADAACLGPGKDRASGGGGKDTLRGEAGNDRLNGGGGKDRLICGAGTRDVGRGGPGKDKAGRCEKGKA